MMTAPGLLSSPTPPRLEKLVGIVLLVAGPVIAVASLLAVGEAKSWDAADAFARESLEPVRRIWMVLSVVGLAALVVTVPALVARAWGTHGFLWLLIGWGAFAFGASLFSLVLGITTIALPALGELAGSRGVSAQMVVDAFIRQPPILAAFLGGNLLFLSWVPIGIGMSRSGRFPPWLGWVVAGTAVLAWLDFLHVPGIEVFAGPLWPLSVAVVGGYLVRGAQERTGAP